MTTEVSYEEQVSALWLMKNQLLRQIDAVEAELAALCLQRLTESFQ